jgi:multicomponent Na+:H+ antiporter subunit E
VKALLLNILLALIWAAAMTSFDRVNLVVGFVLGYLVIWALRPALGEGAGRYLEKMPRAVRFASFFAVELLKSNLRVAWEVLSPTAHRRPGVVAVPLDAATDAEIALLANLITLTPGTLSLDVSADRQTLYVHTMFVDDPDELRAEIKQGFERRLLELLR